LMCRVMLDTSIAWAAALGPKHLRDALRGLLEGLRQRCTLLYSEALVDELRVDQKLSQAKRQAILSLLASIASAGGPRLEDLLLISGRYAKTVNRIGLHDVLIALAAREAGAILATGDWGQAKFYINIAGRTPPPVIYIPLKALA